MLPLDADEILKKIPKADYHVSRKVDGEFTVLMYRDGECCSLNLQTKNRLPRSRSPPSPNWLHPKPLARRRRRRSQAERESPRGSIGLSVDGVRLQIPEAEQIRKIQERFDL